MVLNFQEHKASSDHFWSPEKWAGDPWSKTELPHLFKIMLKCYIKYNQFSSVAELCPTLCDTRDRSKPDNHKILKMYAKHKYDIFALQSV